MASEQAIRSPDTYPQITEEENMRSDFTSQMTEQETNSADSTSQTTEHESKSSDATSQMTELEQKAEGETAEPTARSAEEICDPVNEKHPTYAEVVQHTPEGEEQEEEQLAADTSEEDKAVQAKDTTAEKAVEAKDAAKEEAAQAIDTTTENASEVKDAVADKAEWKNYTSGTAEETGQATSETTGALKAKPKTIFQMGLDILSGVALGVKDVLTGRNPTQ